MTTSKDSRVLSVVHPNCCGLDVHKKVIAACMVLIDESGIKARHDVEISASEFDDFVKETLRIEHQFNTDAGITAQDYRFTETFYEVGQPETGEKIDITDEESAQARQW